MDEFKGLTVLLGLLLFPLSMFLGYTFPHVIIWIAFLAWTIYHDGKVKKKGGGD